MSDSRLATAEMPSYFEFVIGSTVRQSLVASLRRHDKQTAALIDGHDYSDSAVYNALGDLEERQLIVRGDDDRWKLTGIGQLLADWTAVADRTESLIGVDETYWARHDVSVIPASFRREIASLDGAEVVRASPTNPQTVQDRVTDLLASASSVDVMTEIQHPQYARAVEERADVTEPRIVFDADLVTASDAGRYRRPDDWADGVTLRVHDRIEFTLAVIDDRVVLSLPTLDGTYDVYTELIAEGDALDWGRRLFDHYYTAAMPLRAYLAS